MKNLLQLTVITIVMTTAAANAALRTDVPKTKLTLTEAQIAAIKNEMHGPVKKKEANLFAGENYDELAEQLQNRLREAAEITNFRDHTSFDKALAFTALALQAWNPELRDIDIKAKIARNIVEFGFVQGFILPTMALMDKSYAIGNEGFGNLMNVMLADISPELAKTFQSNYGLPTEFNGRGFYEISNLSRNEMWIALLGQLDPDFYQEHNKKVDTTGAARLNQSKDKQDKLNFGQNTTSENYIDSYSLGKEFNSNRFEEKENDFINININGDRTAIAYYLKKIGRNGNSEKIMQTRRLFQNSLGVSTKECATRCFWDVLEGGIKGTSSGEGIGRAIRKYVPQLRTAGLVLGAAHGVDKCIASTECGGSKEQRAAEKAQKDADAKAKEAQNKAYRETMDEYRKQEAAKQLEADKKDVEKMKHLKQMKEDYEKYQKENQKNTEDEAEENEKNESTIHERGGRDINPMIAEEEGSGVTFEDVQKMKQQQGMPTAPDEFASGKVFTVEHHECITKVMEKEKNAPPIKVDIVYPTNPNAGDL